MVRERFRQYSGRIFGRKNSVFRGLRTGQGDHLQDPTWTRRILNIDCKEFILKTRDGQVRKNKLDGLLLAAGLLDTVKYYAIGGQIFYEDPDIEFTEGGPLDNPPLITNQLLAEDGTVLLDETAVNLLEE